MRIGQSEDILMKKARDRLPFLIKLVSLLFLLLLFRAWYLQLIKGAELRVLSENNRVRILPVKAFRGKLLDRNYKEIVNNRPSFNLKLIPEDVSNPDPLLENISQNMSIDIEKIKKDIDSVYFQFQEVNIKKDLSRDEVAFIEEHKLDLPGIFLEIEPLRNYVYKDLAPHMIGYLSEISKKQISNPLFSDYLLGDFIGQYGIEKRYESFLKGKRGQKMIEVDATGREIRTIESKKPISGNNLVLSIDSDLQRVAEKQFKDKNGALVAINLENGDLLAFVNKPAFDPNVFASGISSKNWKKLINDPMKPLQNRAIQGQYPPGSIYKVVTAAAGLEEGAITPESIIECHGYFRLGRKRYKCWNKWGHGKMNLHNAIVKSCDVYFYTVGFRVGIDKLSRYAKEFGLGSITGINLDGEKKGIVPSTEWKKKRLKEKWIAGETISASIGQGYNLVTPIQMAVVFGGIATDGVLWKPRILKRVETPAGEIILENKPEIHRRLNIKPETLTILKNALYGVVNTKGGTGGRSRLRKIGVSGKTGTAQVVSLKETEEGEEEEEVRYEHRDHAWFVGYAPFESPKIVVSVIVEHGGHGGKAAAPIVKQTLKKYFEIYPEKKMPEKSLEKDLKEPGVKKQNPV